MPSGIVVASAVFEVSKLLRNMLQGPANGCFGQFRERDPPIAVPCKLGIERDGPEAGDLQARGRSRLRQRAA